MVRTLALGLLLSVAVFSLPACIGIGGNSDSHPPTQGQQLIDLKAALDKGAITQAEYDQKKAQILAGH